MTQAQAAKTLGVQQPTWADWESGKRVPGTVRSLSIRQFTGGFVPIEAWAQEPLPESEEEDDEEPSAPEHEVRPEPKLKAAG